MSLSRSWFNDLSSAATNRPSLLIALTGYGQKEDRVRSEEAGFHHHFVKPADPRTIQAAIAAWRAPASSAAPAAAPASSRP